LLIVLTTSLKPFTDKYSNPSRDGSVNVDRTGVSCVTEAEPTVHSPLPNCSSMYPSLPISGLLAEAYADEKLFRVSQESVEFRYCTDQLTGTTLFSTVFSCS